MDASPSLIASPSIIASPSLITLDCSQLEQFVIDLANARHRWQHLVRHTEAVRVYEQIWSDEAVNAWVICWSEDQDTGFHDHDRSTAAIAVISGEVREDRLRLTGGPSTRIVRSGSVFTVPRTAIHRVLHSGRKPAVTIHAYSPPLLRSGTYRLDSRSELQREVVSIEEELRAEPALV